MVTLFYANEPLAIQMNRVELSNVSVRPAPETHLLKGLIVRESVSNVFQELERQKGRRQLISAFP